MDAEARSLLQQILDQQQRIMTALEYAGVRIPKSLRSDPEEETEFSKQGRSRRLVEILNRDGLEAYKAALKRENDQRRAKKREKRGGLHVL
jgi:hypothetical protein